MLPQASAKRRLIYYVYKTKQLLLYMLYVEITIDKYGNDGKAFVSKNSICLQKEFVNSIQIYWYATPFGSLKLLF